MSLFYMSFRISALLASSVLSASIAYSQYRFEGAPTGFLIGGVAGPGLLNVRCTENQIADNAGAMERIDWADRCGLVSKEKWSRLYFNNIDYLTGIPTPRAKYAYPIFVHDESATNKTYPLWVPNHASCDVPSDILFFTICEAGCYAPDQKIAFTQKNKPALLPIQKAFETFGSELKSSPSPKESDLRVYSVMKGSTLDSLTFGTLPLKRIVASAKDENNTILTFRTESGGELKVTPEHPLISSLGQFRKAQHFKVGDSLVLQTGQLDPITEILESSFFGKVYNLEPRSSDPTENIHVAQGFLAGSLAVQNGELRDLSRVLQRLNTSSNHLDLK
jgi:hypothetical protein